MTRRNAFAVAGQALGGVAGAIIVLPAVGFALAPLFEEEEETGRRSARSSTSSPTPTPRVITAVQGIGEAGKTTVYVRRGSTDLETKTRTPTSRSRPAAPTSAARSGSSGRRQLHLPVPRWRLWLPGRAHRRPAGAPARPLPDPGPNGQVEIGPRYSVTSQLDPVRARDPGEFTGGIWEYLYPPRPSAPPPP